MMKQKASKDLYGTRRLRILTTASFLTVLISSLCGVWLACEAYTCLFGSLPANKTDLADWARMFALIGLLLAFAMVGVFMGSFLSMAFAKWVLKLPKDIFMAWIDSTNGEARFLRRWNQPWIDWFYD